MDEKHEYFYKIATSPIEFEQIHKLNYHTFSEEIPQHHKNEQQILIDSFHHENTYIICLKQNEVVGMIAIRDNRPFSLDRKIGKVENLLPLQVKQLCEIRLLAVKKEFRNGRVFLGLSQFLANYCLKKGYDAAVISGTVRQLKLYKQMGFEPFSELTGTNEALFQPMYLTKQTFEKSLAGRILDSTLSFLPGPVHISESVRLALYKNPISHRSESFIDKIRLVKNLLCQLTNIRNVQILLGSGTLANDVIAGQLSLISGKGLILVNGEFGHRLVEQASRFNLEFNVLKKEWGQPYSKDEIVRAVSDDTTWIWAVHSETSTGMLNDLKMLKDVSEEHNIKLCLDCISSIGAVNLDLDRVFLASGVSGKALRAFTGLSFVFHSEDVEPSLKLPKYLDLGFYKCMDSIPFSHSSNLIEALLVALEKFSSITPQKIKETYSFIRKELLINGFQIMVPEDMATPLIITIQLPAKISSIELGDNLYYQGYQLHYESNYLREKNWLQIACIGDYEKTKIETMLQLLTKIYNHQLTL